MDEARQHHVACLSGASLHRLAYREWGDPANPRVLVCVHGLSRQSRDFDVLASAMSDRYRVICPDMPGRGDSDWLDDPAAYIVPTYVSNVVTLLARLDVEQVDWVGTSMGGLIGLGLASLATRDGHTLVRRMVLNDVGPTIEPSAITRIAAYLGSRMQFDDLGSGIEYLRGISSGFGSHSAERWEALSRPMFRPDPERAGGWRLHYDPRIAVPIRATTPEIARAGEAFLWALYERLRGPVLLLRGADSDLLTAETATAMTARGPRAQLRVFEGVGHAPMLVEPEQIAVLREFLDGT